MGEEFAPALGLDEASVRFENKASKVAYIWRQFSDCFECPLVFWAPISPAQTLALKNSTNSDQIVAITARQPDPLYLTTNEELFCRQTYSLRDQSVHNITITENGGAFQCEHRIADEGRNNIWPLVVAVGVYVTFAAVFYVSRRLFRRYRERNAMTITTDPTPLSTDESKAADDKKRKRLKSLDCFRGITILMMIFVNMGAGGYEYLDHAHWDGFNFADVIFPWFIFIMGTTMAISLKSQVVRQKTPVWRLYYQICKRALTLFVIGLILNSNGNANWKTVRIPGVLQRFGITYLVVASAHVVSLRLHKGELFGALRIHQLVDVIPYWPEWIVMSFTALLYFVLTFGWNFDDKCPKGYIGPGGLANNMSHIHCTGGAAAYIDRWLLGEKHLYPYFTGNRLYDPVGQFGLLHDPEGVLGTTTSILLTFFGLQMGKILIAYPSPKQRIVRWLSWAAILGALAALFAATGWIPINKNLWSFSFICLTSASACVAISLLYYLVDVARVWPNGQPFHYPGMNSILLYIGHELTSSMLPWSFNVDETSHVGPLARNLVATTLWFVISVRLAQNNFFLTV